MSDAFDIGADDPVVEPAAAAIGLALGVAGTDPSIAADASEFLRKQSRYLELQMEDLHEQRDLTLSHLKWRRFNDWMRAAWQASLAIAAVSAVLIVAIAMWSAHEAGGLVVQAFKTPPEFAAKGLDGALLAQRLLDKLNGLVVESEPVAFHSADSIRGDWGDDSKVEIPETGVSVGEFSRSLRGWLGHETHVSGEVWPTANGIALTVRADNKPSITVTGPEADLDKLLDRAAEKMLAQTQPYRYAAVLDQRGSYAQAIAFLRPIALGGAPADRAWAYTFWSNSLAFTGDDRGAIALADMGIRLAPSDPTGYFAHVSDVFPLGQNEAVLKDLKAEARLMAGSTPESLSASAAAAIRPLIPVGLCSLAGDFVCSASAARVVSQQIFDGYQYGDLLVASELARAHDGGAARALLAEHPQWNDGTALAFSGYIGTMMPSYFVLANAGQWSRAAADMVAADRAAQSVYGIANLRHTWAWPLLAYAWARSGNVKGADTLIALTPLDCTLCLEMRGRIADVKRNTASAAYWFGRAVQDAPSIPFAMSGWGEMLLHRGDFAGAIAKFAAANRTGPHFADPLELWGEALVAENRSDLAVAKFADAAKYAPHWGRLHLKWGEALFWLGRTDDARAQYRIAAALDLSAADTAALGRASALNRAPGPALR